MSLDKAFYQIREATDADARTVAIHRAMMFRDMGYLDEKAMELLREVSEPWIRSLLQERTYAGWLLTKNDEIVGGGGMHLLTFGPKPGFLCGGLGAHIANVYVEPTHRKCGLAQEMMKVMLQWAKAKGIQEITLSSSEEAKPLYRSLGFVANPDYYVLSL